MLLYRPDTPPPAVRLCRLSHPRTPAAVIVRSSAMQHRRLLAMTVAAALLVGRARAASAQELTWKNAGTFYLDNTEFFNPYRTGETLLGGQILSYLSAALGP